jgi:hypothetical protein
VRAAARFAGTLAVDADEPAVVGEVLAGVTDDVADVGEVVVVADDDDDDDDDGGGVGDDVADVDDGDCWDEVVADGVAVAVGSADAGAAATSSATRASAAPDVTLVRVVVRYMGASRERSVTDTGSRRNAIALVPAAAGRGRARIDVIRAPPRRPRRIRRSRSRSPGVPARRREDGLRLRVSAGFGPAFPGSRVWVLRGSA